MSLANDKVGHHVRLIAANALKNSNVIRSGFENVIQSDSYAFIGSGERSRSNIFVGETAPSTNYDAIAVGGDEYNLLTYSSNVVTTKDKYVYSYSAWRKYLTDDVPVIQSTATAARATALGRWSGARVKSIISGTVDCSAVEQHGIYVETECTGTAKSGNHYGIKIETYVTADATLGDHYGIGVFTYDNRAGSNQLHVARLEHNGANVGNAFLGLFAAANKMAYLIESSTTDDDWMKISSDAMANAGGYYRVKHGGYTRYIKLWTATS